MISKSKEKSKFRATSVWKKFRKQMDDKFNHTDPITNYPLRKGHNLHHLNLNPNEYTNITNEDHFIPLNKNTHEVIHFCYNYAKKDPEFMKRLCYFVQKMIEINNL